MQTRDMERTNSMSRGKRSLEGEEGQQQPQPKRPAVRRTIMESSSSNANLLNEQRMKILKMERSRSMLEIKLIKQKHQIELMKVQQEVPTKGISIKEANEPAKAPRPKLPVNTGKGKTQIPSQKGKKPTASSIHNPKPTAKQPSRKERAVVDSSLSKQPLVQVQPSQNQSSQKERTLVQGLLDLLSNQSHVQPSQPGVELSPETPNTSQHIKFIDRPRYFLNASNRKFWRLGKKSKVLAEHHEMLTEIWSHIRAGTQDPAPVKRLEKTFTQFFELIQGIQNALNKQGEDPSQTQSCWQPEPDEPEPEPEPEVARPTSTGNH